MDFSLFVLFFFTTLLLCITFLSLINAKRLESGKDVSSKSGLCVCASIILGWILLQCATAETLFPFKEFVFGFFPFLVGVAALSMYPIKKAIISSFWIYLFVSILSVIFLPNNWLVFQGYLPLFFDRFLTAVLWSLFICLYAKMDKVEALTQTQTTALCLVFSIFPFFSKTILTSYSDIFSYYPMLILSALIGFITYKKRYPELSMGKTGAIPLGYLMGLFFIFIAVKGYYMAFLIMPAYYYFEIVYSAIYRFWYRQTPQPFAFSFFISKTIRDNLNTKGIMPLLLLVMIGLGLTALLFNQSYQMMFTLTGMLFFYLIYRFLTWGRPKITYRSMFYDTKEAIGQIGSNIKDSYQTVSDFWKNKKK